MKHTLWKRMAVGVFVLTAVAMIAGCAEKESTGEKKSKTQAEQTAEMQTEEVVQESHEPLVFENRQRLPLWETAADMPFYSSEVHESNTASITPYIVENNESKSCVIICPGGGYTSLATKKEGIPVAEAWNAQGVSAFVLQYRITPYHYEAMLADVCRAVRYVRYYAEDFGVDPDKIVIMGFSAGGHLAAMNLEHAAEDTQNTDAIDKMDARANAGVLCYPVISLQDEYGHAASRDNFLGDAASDETLVKKYSAEEGVDESMPPVFIWHCKGDTIVPYENSQIFADAMEEAGVQCELHLYDGGEHGLALSEGESAEGWFDLCVDWMKKLEL